MKTLTLHRPWTTLVIRGDKPIENRTWTTKHRGWLLIHGGRGWDDNALKVAAELGYALSPYPENHPTGILGAVYLLDVCSRLGACGCGLWAFSGKHHWLFDQPIVFRKPIECSGKQGLWTAPVVADMHFASVI